MGIIVDLIDKVKRYYSFSPSELRGLIISAIAIAFIISFKDWGNENVNLVIGLFNFLQAMLIVSLSIWFHVSVQRVWALGTGYKLEWKMWNIGIFLGLIFVFLSNGNFWLILPGGFIVHHMGGHRLGWFRYGINFYSLGLIAVMGCIGSIILAILFKVIGGFVFSPFIQKAIIFNIAYALFSMLPIPPLDGSRIFFGGRMLYAFSVAQIVSVSILLVLKINILLAILLSIIIAFVLWILYYIFFEQHTWAAA